MIKSRIKRQVKDEESEEVFQILQNIKKVVKLEN